MAPILNRVGRHVDALWPGRSWMVTLPLVLWPAYWLLRGEYRWEYAAFLVVVPLLAYTNRRTRNLFLGLYPIALLGLVYDGMRFTKNVGLSADTVHVCDLRSLEMRWFGMHDATGSFTTQDWLQAHATPWLDYLCALPYGTFIYVSLGFAIYLATRDDAAFRRFGWSFLVVNLLGFATYHLYPAAPPWYFHAHGCTVDLAAKASEGANLARVDAALGVRYFAGFYGRSNDVFGAVPSLHVAYPTLMLLEGWRWLRWPGRTLSALFALWMCFSAIYLDHHWIIDILLGLFYTAVTYWAVCAIFGTRAPSGSKLRLDAAHVV